MNILQIITIISYFYLNRDTCNKVMVANHTNLLTKTCQQQNYFMHQKPQYALRL